MTDNPEVIVTHAPGDAPVSQDPVIEEIRAAARRALESDVDAVSVKATAVLQVICRLEEAAARYQALKIDRDLNWLRKTARGYGPGELERLIGDALREYHDWDLGDDGHEGEADFIARKLLEDPTSTDQVAAMALRFTDVCDKEAADA